MSSVIDVNELPWEPVRTDVAVGVFGRTVFNEGMKMVCTRVAPGGGFAPHRDGYGHLLYILKGSGIAGAGGEEYQLAPGKVIRIEAGEVHFYSNTGVDDLELISVNIPA
jgi:quercetin dioxygenase-like cupin family protein